MDKHNERAELIAALRSPDRWMKLTDDQCDRAAAMLEAQPAEQANGRQAADRVAMLLDALDEQLAGEMAAMQAAAKTAKGTVAAMTLFSHFNSVRHRVQQIKREYATPPAQPAREWDAPTKEMIDAAGEAFDEYFNANPFDELTSGKAVACVMLEAALREKNAGLPAAVPDGYVLVPVEPTPEMMQAAFDTKVAVGYGAAYRAMLAAAPKPQDDLPAILKKQAS